MKLTTNLFGEIIITISKEEVNKLLKNNASSNALNNKALPELPRMQKKTDDFLKEIKSKYGSSKIKRNDIELRKIANKYMLLDITSLLMRLYKLNLIEINWSNKKERKRIDTFVIKY